MQETKKGWLLGVLAVTTGLLLSTQLLMAQSGVRVLSSGGSLFTAQETQYCSQVPEECQIQDISIEKIGPAVVAKGGSSDTPPESTEPPSPIGSIDIGNIINIAYQVWNIIKENAPVVNISKEYASALPDGIQHWTQLAYWNPPVGTIYTFKAVNNLGRTVVDVKYQVLRTYGGTFVGQDGVRRGQYLTGVTVEPLKVSVPGFAYRLDMIARAPVIVNAGSPTDPIAAMNLNLEWAIRTPLQHESATSVYYLRGDGFFKEVSGPFKNDLMKNASRALESARTSVFW